MPYAHNRGIRLYWEQEGQGEPLLLIMGLGFSLAMWQNLRPIMARHFQTILFDNRGVGNSSIPLRPFSMRAMADDAAAVMDDAGVQSAHVLGMSMGGMIAQELTLEHPGRVRKLVLGCTQCGGPHAIRADLEVLRAISPFSFVSRARRLSAIVPFIYDPGTPRERVERDLEVVRRNPPHILGYSTQLAAILAWRSYDRLPQIKSPTLVIHGETDRLVPPGNGQVIASRIPGARLVLLPNASHIFPTDQPEKTRAELLRFLTGSASAAY